MIPLFKQLQPFFEENYRRIHVREYSRLLGISPPTASKFLEEHRKSAFLLKEEEKGYILYFASRTPLFIKLQQAYYQEYFEELIKHIESELLTPVIILFGSFAKAEITVHSDIDLAIFSPSKKEMNLSAYEKRFKREIQLFQYKNREDAEKNPELLSNILNGVQLSGSW